MSSVSTTPAGSIGGGHQPLTHYNLHLIPAVISFIQIHREFIVAGLRSPQLVQALLKQLPAATRNAIEEFSTQLRERMAAAGTLHAQSGGPHTAPSSPSSYLYYYNSSCFSENYVAMSSSTAGHSGANDKMGVNTILRGKDGESVSARATGEPSSPLRFMCPPDQLDNSGRASASSFSVSFSAEALAESVGGRGAGGGGGDQSPSYPRRLPLDQPSPTHSFRRDASMSSLSQHTASPSPTAAVSATNGTKVLAPLYTLEQMEHLNRFRVALIGCPDRRCDPLHEDDILPSPPTFGLSQGCVKRIKAFLSMPCNSDLVFWLNAKLGNPNNIANAHIRDDEDASTNLGLVRGESFHMPLSSGVGYGQGIGMIGVPSAAMQPSLAEALQFAAAMWLQRFPNDHAAQNIEQQRCRRAGVVFSHQDVVRILQEERAHLAKAARQEMAGNASRQEQHASSAAQAATSTSSNKTGGGGSKKSSPAAAPDAFEDRVGDEEGSGGDDDEDENEDEDSILEDNKNASTTTAILLSKTANATSLGLSTSANALFKNQMRLERQKRQLLLCNLRLHFPNEIPQWMAMIVARDECLQDLKDERIELEKVAARLTSSSSSPHSSSESSTVSQPSPALVTAFVKLIVLAENACNGLQHTNYNATPTDLADLITSKLSPILIEGKLLKAAHLPPDASAAVAGKDIDEIRQMLEDKIAEEEEAARAAARKKTPFGFLAAKIREAGAKVEKERADAAGCEGGEGNAAAGASSGYDSKKSKRATNIVASSVTSLDLTVALHVEALMSVATKCLRAIYQPSSPES